MVIIFTILWVVVGVASFIYWWTLDHDLTVSTTPLMIIGALAGPISFLIGWFIHGPSPHVRDRVLMKKRK